MELIQIFIMVVCVILCLLIWMPEVMCIILAAGLFFSVGLSLFSSWRWNHRIDKLTNYLLQVQDRLDLPELQDISEGRIGLSMARQIILRQEGVITAESEVGKGTRFHVKFYS